MGKRCVLFLIWDELLNVIYVIFGFEELTFVALALKSVNLSCQAGNAE
jgi:hypothetical protein